MLPRHRSLGYIDPLGDALFLEVMENKDMFANKYFTQLGQIVKFLLHANSSRYNP